VALQYGEKTNRLTINIGSGLVGYAALHKEAVLVDDVSSDPRYIPLVADVRSELVIPLLVKDRCVGVFDLESPELAAFNSRHIDILRILASQTAVAIENARLYEAVINDEERLEREIEFARRVQKALLPTDIPRRQRGIDVAARFEPASQIGGDLYDFLAPDPNTLVVAVGDVSGKGVPAALYGAFVGELVRSRTFRRRFTAIRSSPAGVLGSMNTILHERQLEGYFCTLSYTLFDLRRRTLTIANSGLPYAIRRSAGKSAAIELPGVPLGALPATVYDERTFDLAEGDLYVFYTDGISEACDARDREFGTDRIVEIVEALNAEPTKRIVDGIFEAVGKFREEGPPADDMTVVAVRITS
jgi:sigma-B regulation protein RsbU (phosphoserine phosphatase)